MFIAHYKWFIQFSLYHLAILLVLVPVLKPPPDSLLRLLRYFPIPDFWWLATSEAIRCWLENRKIHMNFRVKMWIWARLSVAYQSWVQQSAWKQSRCSVLSMTSQSLAPIEQMQDLEKLIDPNESKMGSNRRSNERNWRKCHKSKFSNTFMASAYCISSFLSLPLSLLVPLAHPV